LRRRFLPLVVRLDLGDTGIPDRLDVGGHLLVAGRQLLDGLGGFLGFGIERLPDRFAGLSCRTLDGAQRLGRGR
jgi:hypothetical protein